MRIILIMFIQVVTYREIKECTQIKTFPTNTKVHTSREVRMRITDNRTVIRVDLTIVVHIFHLELTYVLRRI